MGQLKQGAIGLVTDLVNFVSIKNRICARVDTNPVGEPFGNFFIDVSFRRIFNGALKKEEPCNSHFIHGESTSLIRANVICTSHSFACLKETDQVILIFHLSNRVS